MSNRRRPGLMRLYRSDFLHSDAWFARRNRWFTRQAALNRPLVCAGCERPAARTALELHHLDYAGVDLIEGHWIAHEPHGDLVPMHPYCHELLHRLIDRDDVLSRNRTRRAANHLALDRLRHKLQTDREES